MTLRNNRIIQDTLVYSFRNSASHLPFALLLQQSSCSMSVGALMRCDARLGVFPCGTKRLVSNLRGSFTLCQRPSTIPPLPTPPSVGDLPSSHSISKSGNKMQWRCVGSTVVFKQAETLHSRTGKFCDWCCVYLIQKTLCLVLCELNIENVVTGAV